MKLALLYYTVFVLINNANRSFAKRRSHVNKISMVAFCKFMKTIESILITLSFPNQPNPLLYENENSV